ncbi:MAG: DUF1775 domain-containing protein [Pseudonocardiaceae bacterium]|nr:DUF1775 domain-containing protein [Pseudonocardiaceae bacterium]
MSRTRLIAVTLVAFALLLGLAAPAAAHVTAQPEQATQGDYTAFTFRVPNERDDAGTVKVEVRLPAEHPISSVRTKPIPGWSVAMTKNGQAVRTITWTAQPGVRIAPDQYQEFEISAGPLPADTERLVMPTVQTYASGEVVAWDDPPTQGGEPEHPAPVVELLPPGNEGVEHGSPAATAGTTQAGQDATARWLGGTGLAVGALGLGLAAGAVLRMHRRDSA